MPGDEGMFHGKHFWVGILAKVGRSTQSSKKKGNRDAFPWALWLALIVSLLVFWLLPNELGKHPIKVDFQVNGDR